MKLFYLSLVFAVSTGCTTTGSLNSALGTPKNPPPILSSPWPNETDRLADKKTKTSGNPFVDANYKVLLEAVTADMRLASPRVGDTEAADQIDFDMRRYLGAGFALSDIYCEGFFRKVDESQRRRRYGRALTNDFGTAFTTILGLANAAKDTLTGSAAIFGLADGAWRNYDEAFALGPDLSSIKSLSMAAQDDFRNRSLASDSVLPGDYGTAQSVILKYANFCSALGVKSLLDASAAAEKKRLDAQSEAKGATTKPGTTPPVPTSEQAPATTQPVLSANQKSGI